MVYSRKVILNLRIKKVEVLFDGPVLRNEFS